MGGKSKTPRKHLNFVSMMRADSKGKKRPCIIGLDWNVKPNEIRDGVESAVVVAISDQIHVFAEVEYIRRNWKWRMLLKVKYPEGGVKCVKWNPENPLILAVGSVDGAGNVILDFFEWQNNRFIKERSLVISDTTVENLSSMSWSTDGSYIIGNVEHKDAKGCIVIIRDPTGAEFSKEVIETKYNGPFYAIFKPYTEYIYSASSTTASITVWSKIDNSWRPIQTIPNVGANVKMMCFNSTGTQLAAIGDGLKVWSTGEKNKKTGAYKFPMKNIKFAFLDKKDVDLEKESEEDIKLSQHFDTVVSLDFTGPSTLITGSSHGTICIHLQPGLSGSENRLYVTVGLKWQGVQQHDPYGAITCIANNPQRPGHYTEVLSGGTDGIVALWKVSDTCSQSIRRNELFEKKCYSPEWEDYKDEHMARTGRVSITSITTYISNEDQEEIHFEGIHQKLNAKSAADDRGTETTTSKDRELTFFDLLKPDDDTIGSQPTTSKGEISFADNLHKLNTKSAIDDGGIETTTSKDHEPTLFDADVDTIGSQTTTSKGELVKPNVELSFSDDIFGLLQRLQNAHLKQEKELKTLSGNFQTIKTKTGLLVEETKSMLDMVGLLAGEMENMQSWMTNQGQILDNIFRQFDHQKN